MSTPIAPFWRRLLPGAALLLLPVLGSRCLLPRTEPSPVPEHVPAAAPLPPPCLATLPASVSPEPRLVRARAVARTRAEQPEGWVELGEGWLRQAQRSADAGYVLNATDCVQRALELAPEHVGAQGLLAHLKLEAHDFAQARELALGVLARSPEDTAALGTLSDAALELGDVALASQSAQQLMDLHPGLPAYARASYLRWLHGQEPDAIELARLGIDAAGDPDEADARAWMLVQAAQLFWQRGDYAGAEAGQRMALATNPSYAPALLGLGRVALSRGDHAAAAAAFSRALAAHPSVEAAAWLGDVQAELGDPAAAAQSYARAEQLGRLDARSLSLFYSTREREPARALELALSESRTRGDLYTEDALGWALYRNGRFSEALQHSERALALGTRDALLWFHHGAIQMALGQRAAGEALLRRALRQNPHFDPHGAAEARRLLGRAA